MKDNITVTVARDVATYATVVVPADTDLSYEGLRSIAENANNNAVFKPYWDSASGLRVVAAVDETGRYIEGCCDVYLEQNFDEFGRSASMFLLGKITLDELVESAKDYKVIEDDSHVNLQPIKVGVQVLNGCVSSVDVIASKHLKGIATVVDHDAGEDAGNYSIDGTDVRVDDVVMSNIDSYPLDCLEGSVGELVKKFNEELEENGIFEVINSKQDWELASQEGDEEIIFEMSEVDDRDDGELAYTLRFDREDLRCNEILATLTVIKVNYYDENDREVIYESNVYATELIRRLMEKDQ